MSENKIKSEKAMELIQKGEYTMYGERIISIGYVTKAIHIVETEAEERHTKELQEFNDKAAKAHRECCSFYSGFDGGYCSRKSWRKPCDWTTDDCKYMQNFLTQLNK